MSASFFYGRFPRLMFLLRKLERANYEREMELLDILCDAKKRSVDIGAKVGMYTYRIMRHSRATVAFEPNPIFNRMLEVALPECRVEPFAVSNVAGEARLRIPHRRSGRAIYGRATIESGNPLEHEVASVDEVVVQMRTLDGYEFDDIGFIKIDVEGHELTALEGAEQTVTRCKPNLLIEANDRHRPGAVASLRAWFDAHGYRAFFVSPTLLPVDRLDPTSRFEGREIENFIGVHESNAATIESLRKRLG